MATFPTLKSGAAAQYPLGWSAQYVTQAVQFLDGSRHRYRIAGGALRRWQVKLDLLDESELGAVIAFVDGQGSDAFTFVDPVSGASAEKCVLSGDPFQALMDDEMHGRASLVIEEIR
jgi:hypothetical protein